MQEIFNYCSKAKVVMYFCRFVSFVLYKYLLHACVNGWGGQMLVTGSLQCTAYTCMSWPNITMRIHQIPNCWNILLSNLGLYKRKWREMRQENRSTFLFSWIFLSASKMFAYDIFFNNIYFQVILFFSYVAIKSHLIFLPLDFDPKTLYRTVMLLFITFLYSF